MIKLTETIKTKKCTICEKKFSIELGFYAPTDSYCKTCKINVERERYISNKDYYENHLYDKEDEFGVCKCKRCGLLKKEVAIKVVNRFRPHYLVKGKWVLERPNCIEIKH